MEDKKGQADKSKNSQEKEPINLEDFEGPEYDEIKKQYDPLRVFLRERGFDPEEPHFTYRTVEKLKKEDPKNADKVTGCQPISFDNYHDLLKFRQTLSDEEKREFDSFTWDDGKKNWKGIAVLADSIFWKNIYDSNHELYKFRNDFSVLMEGTKEERLKDEYLEAVKRGEVRNFKEDIAQIFKQREDLICSFGEVSDLNEIFKKVRELEALEKDLEQNRDYINHSGNEEWRDILWESVLKFEDSELLERFLKEIEWIRDKGPEYLDRLIADDPNVVKPYFSFEKYPFVGEAILRLAKSKKIEYNRERDEEEDKNKQTEKEEGKGRFWEFRGKNKKDKPKKENAEEMQKIAQETVGAEVFAQERGDYIRACAEYKRHYGGKGLKKFKEIIIPLRDFIEKGDKNGFINRLKASGISELKADVIYDMEAAKLAYDNRKKEYIDDAVLNKRTELENEKRVGGDELEEELKKFRAEKLFGMVSDEMKRLELEKIESHPPKDKALWKKLLDNYSKIPRKYRILGTTALMTGVFATLGGGVATVGATGVMAHAGWRLLRGFVSAEVAQGVGKVIDLGFEWAFKPGNENQRIYLKELAQEGSIEEFENEFQAHLENLKSEARIKLLAKTGGMLLAGLGTSAGIGMLEHSLLGGGVGKVDEVPSKKETVSVGQKPESTPAEPSVKQPIEKLSEQLEVKESEAPAEPAKTLSPKEKIPFAPKKLVESLGVEKEAVDQRADAEISDQQADAEILDQKADMKIPDQKTDATIHKETGDMPDQIADGKVFDQKADGELIDQKADGGAIDQKADGVSPDQQADKIVPDQKADGVSPDQQADKIVPDQKADGLASQENKNNLEVKDQIADSEKTSVFPEDQPADKEILDQKTDEKISDGIKDQRADGEEVPSDQKADAEAMDDQPADKDILDQKGDKFTPDALPVKEIDENLGDVLDQQADLTDMDSEDFNASDSVIENRIPDSEIYKEGVKLWLEKTTGITNIEKTGWLNENYLKTHTVRDVLNPDFVNKNFRIDQPYIRGTKEWIEWHDKLAFNEQVEKVLREQVPFWERWGTAKDMKLEEFLIKYGGIKIAQ